MRRNHNTTTQTRVTRFVLGQTFITPGAEEALQIAGQTAIEFLRRHMSCDWGELSEDDLRENELSLKKGFRLLSNYHRKGPTALDHHGSGSQCDYDSSAVRV